MKKVLIVDRLLMQYRVDFFNRLKKNLFEKGIELHLIYGKSKKDKNTKNDETDIIWAKFIPNKTFYLGGKEIIWQPIRQELKKYDLVIVEYANRNLINYYLIFKRLFFKLKMAFWGHRK